MEAEGICPALRTVISYNERAPNYSALRVFVPYRKLAIKLLRYYATFRVRKFEYTCLQKTSTCIGLQAEQIFSVNI